MKKVVFLVICCLVMVPAFAMAGGHGGPGGGGKAVVQFQNQNLGQFQAGTGVSLQGYCTNASQSYGIGSHGGGAGGTMASKTMGAQATLGGFQAQGMSYSASQGAVLK